LPRVPQPSVPLARTARQGGNDRHLVAVLERCGESVERLDRLAVYVDIDVVVHLAALVAHEPLETSEGLLELVEEPADRLRRRLEAIAVVRRPSERRRDVHGDRHTGLLTSPLLRPAARLALPRLQPRLAAR